ncbi:TatD family hydrolase [Fibrobacter intestinalis]|uniref:TatD family hydrolase n=1 Tax=Fibrobacter intestinalis TaxID=28122 RepID=UPI0023F2A70F|nr:TatD family hydrolase [Fibrobacter intestinalis]MDD7297805.1 TatD family hydrolase [Fibrobacter intestinalis]
MNFVDSHCHMDSFTEKSGIDLDSWWNTVSPKPDAILHVACEKSGFDYAEKISRLYPNVYTAFGIHPQNADSYDAETEECLMRLWASPKTVGIGEIGFDYHYETASRKKQREVFERQLEIGSPFHKVFVLHLREADDDSLNVLQHAHLQNATLHIHSCTASCRFVEAALQLPCRVYVGFTGILTFKNAESVREAASRVPLNRLLLETDSPYLAPVPFRGKPSHAGMIPQIGEVLAQVKNIPFEELMKQVRQNTRDCYGI